MPRAGARCQAKKGAESAHAGAEPAQRVGRATRGGPELPPAFGWDPAVTPGGEGLGEAVGVGGPEAEVGEGLCYNRGLVKECKDPHASAIAGTQ